MSYPSLNVRSAALPPPATPTRNRSRFLSHLSLSRSKSSDSDAELPLMTMPDSPLSPNGARPTSQTGQPSSEPASLWERRSGMSTIGSINWGHGRSASVIPTASSTSSPASARLSDQYIFRSASSDGVPQASDLPALPSSPKPVLPPRPPRAFRLRSPPCPQPALLVELASIPALVPARPPPPRPELNLSVDTFAAVLISQKTVTLPPQPPSVSSAAAPLETLVQLQVAGSTFIISLRSIERYPSHLARFANGCTATTDYSEDDIETDGTFSSIDESDIEPHLPSTKAGNPSYETDVPSSPPSPPFNLRASSMTKLQKLGLLPPRNPSTGFLPDPATPRPEPTSINRADLSARQSDSALHRPSKRPKPANRSMIRFLNILLFRSPDSYAAVAYFYSHGALLPSLRTILEGETACRGCPLCGDADRVRRLREVESEAEFLGLEGLARLCRRERLGQEGRDATRPPVSRKGSGWI